MNNTLNRKFIPINNRKEQKQTTRKEKLQHAGSIWDICHKGFVRNAYTPHATEQNKQDAC